VLQKLGIQYNYSDAEVLQALYTYKQLHGNLMVHRKFVVPYSDANWSPQLGGLKLGRAVQQIRINNAYSEYRDTFLDMGFVYDEDEVGSGMKECA
jgi:hypothetical protein